MRGCGPAQFLTAVPELHPCSVPPNGLVVYCGSIVTDEGKEKKVNIDFEPFKAINTSLYLCDNKFHTEALSSLLSDDSMFGFIVMDGNGTLFGTLSGNAREIIHKFTVDLPKKHGRGGQSALRFARLRMEKRHNYVRKVAEESVRMFITDDKCNVQGLVLAGSADFKVELSQSDLFDNRLVQKVRPCMLHVARVLLFSPLLCHDSLSLSLSLSLVDMRTGRQRCRLHSKHAFTVEV
jgi:peptide chain release factor subunit 1